MARKKKEEAQQTRQQLIEAAIGQFATRGVANTTLTDIADAANVTRGAIYWHFTSKAEIFNAIWEQQLPLRDIIRDRLSLSEGDDPLLILREQFITALQYIAREPRQCALLQILYHKCEFSSDMISERDIRKRIGFNYDTLRASLEALRGVRHPHLEAVLEISDAGQRLWWVSEYLPGGDLRERLQKAPSVPADTALCPE